MMMSVQRFSPGEHHVKIDACREKSRDIDPKQEQVPRKFYRTPGLIGADPPVPVHHHRLDFIGFASRASANSALSLFLATDLRSQYLVPSLYPRRLQARVARVDGYASANSFTPYLAGGSLYLLD